MQLALLRHVVPEQSAGLGHIKTALPYTLSIAVGAAAIFLIFGVLIGVTAALHRGKWPDKIAVAISSLGVSLPAPFIGLLFLWIVVSKWQLLPYTSNTVTSPWNPDPWTWFKNYILAWLTLALIFGANYVRLTRANMIETMGEDYIRTARAKGLPSRTVTLKHGLRAAITPVVTVFGLDLGALTRRCRADRDDFQRARVGPHRGERDLQRGSAHRHGRRPVLGLLHHLRQHHRRYSVRCDRPQGEVELMVPVSRAVERRARCP